MQRLWSRWGNCEGDRQADICTGLSTGSPEGKLTWGSSRHLCPGLLQLLSDNSRCAIHHQTLDVCSGHLQIRAWLCFLNALDVRM